MFEFENQRGLVVLLTTGIIIVVIISIVALINIWIPKNEKIETKFEVGVISVESLAEEEIVKKYYTEIFALLLNKEYSELYSKLSEDYVKHSNMTETKLRNLIDNERVTGQLLDLNKYQVGNMQGYNAIYVLELKVKDSIDDIRIVIRENSPKDYTISFDEFVASKENSYVKVNDSIYLEVEQVNYFTTKVEYNVKMRNTHNNNIILNSNGSYESLLLKLADNQLLEPYVIVFGGQKIILIPGQEKRLSLVYNLENMNYYTISGLVIKNVLYTNPDRTSDVLFSL